MGWVPGWTRVRGSKSGPSSFPVWKDWQRGSGCGQGTRVTVEMDPHLLCPVESRRGLWDVQPTSRSSHSCSADTGDADQE